MFENFFTKFLFQNEYRNEFEDHNEKYAAYLEIERGQI